VTAHAEPRWLKGNLHTHSLWSDGNDYPEMIVDWYARHGYHFLALSDHNVLSQGQRWMSVAQADKRAKHDGFARYRERFGDAWVETRTVDGDEQVRLKPLGEYRTLFERPGQFLLIQGEEITDKFETKPIHMNASNVQELIKPQGGKSVAETMANNLAAVEEQARRLGRPILGHLNHPNFGYAITAEELAMVTKERFFEVYNGHPLVNLLGDSVHASSERIWDIVLTHRFAADGGPLYGVATDDSHDYHRVGTDQRNPGRGWIVVRSARLDADSLMAAMQRGDFYASTGVELTDVRRAGSHLTLTIRPAAGVTYTTQFIGTRRGWDTTSVAVRDSAGRVVTRRYSRDVGAVLAEVRGASPAYQFRGDELYVRARVVSSRPKANGSLPREVEMAWTQPARP
jgi:hypothetical protein